jgi:hypothetical protein
MAVAARAPVRSQPIQFLIEERSKAANHRVARLAAAVTAFKARFGARMRVRQRW